MKLHIQKDILSRYEGFRGTKERFFELNSKLYRHFIAKTEPDNLFGDGDKKTIFESIVSGVLSRSNSEQPFLLCGKPGSGKSSVLSLTYLWMHKNREMLSEKGYIPAYIDLAYYDARPYRGSSELNNEAKNLFLQNLEVMQKVKDEYKDHQFLFIMDGYTEINNTPVDIGEFAIKTIEEKFAHCKIIGSTLPFHKDDRKSDPGILVARKVLLDEISVNAGAGTREICVLLSEIFGVPECAGKIEEMIGKIALEKADVFLLSIMADGCAGGCGDVSSMAELLERSAKNFLKTADSGGDIAASMEKAAEMAFERTVLQKIYKRDELICAGELHPDGGVKLRPEWRLIHKNESMRNFLIAHHVMKQLKSGNFTEGRGDVFQIYPHSVNHFVRELLRGEPHPNQENILDFVSDWYNKLEHRLFSDRGIPKDVMYRSCYAAYLLGRISEKDLIVKAKDIIRNCIGDLDSKISHDTESQKNRSLLLLIRSFCISSIILGDKKCSGEYIEKMLDNPTWDDINRGFHLEYYGDLPYRYGAKYSVEMTDSNLEDFSNTFSMLSGRVSKDLKKKRPENNLFEVEVYTLASLAVNRQLNGVLDADIRSKLSRMVGEIQKKDADYIHCRRLSEYLLFAEKILREEKYGANSVLFFLYRLKSQKRIGWKKRNISEPESVADHTWGCMLLAALYLPEDTEEDKESKRNIMNMLAIHDLAESELGDIPTPQKKEDDSRKENEWMQSMLSASGQWSYSNPGYFYRLWAKFKTARSGGAREDDARVAFEIDKLENLVQLEVYHEKFPGKITDYKKWKNDLIREIQTEKGKKIRDVILKGKLIRDVGK